MERSGIKIKIVLADDHEIFRDGFISMIKKFPHITVVGEAANGIELIELVKKLKPNIALTDIRMPGLDGLEATKLITRDMPYTRVIALSMYDEDELIVEMLEAGAKGYLLKNAHKTDIIEAINAVNDNKTYYCNQTSKKLISLIARSDLRQNQSQVHFTAKEIEIIKLICDQLINKEIADRMNLSKRTVESYREKIQEKMNVRNTAGIVIYAIKNRIIEI